jgi:methionine synthase II (cobalamin-independent)
MGNVPDVEWRQLADYAALEAIRAQEQLGLDLINDGEQRRDGFHSFVTRKLAGMKSMKVAELSAHLGDPKHFDRHLQEHDVPGLAIKAAVAVDSLRIVNPAEGLALDEVEFITANSASPVKIICLRARVGCRGLRGGPTRNLSCSRWTQSEFSARRSSSCALAELP